MKTLRRWQTIAPDAHRILRLPGSVKGGDQFVTPLLSPYFQMKDLREEAPGRDIQFILVFMANRIGLVCGFQSEGTGLDILVNSWDVLTPFTNHGTDLIYFDSTGLTTPAAIYAAGIVAANAFATANGFVYSSFINEFTTASDVNSLIDAATSAMIVGGVAKANTYAVASAPAVAGGSGVVRFYTDSNGDGTGTAPSEIELSTLQAYVVNTSAVYVIGSISVDTNRKYIDITMKALTFATGLAGLLSVITGASLANAANGTSVNCFVIVKK